MKKFVSIICAITILISLSGCRKKTPDVAASKFLDSIINFDIDKIESNIVNSEDIEIPGEIANAFAKHTENITYTITEFENDETSANVKVNITYPDLAMDITLAIADYSIEAMMMVMKGTSDDELKARFETILADTISNATPEMKNADIIIVCSMTDNGWKVDTDINSVFNGILDSYRA